jgi:hypothetical protein
MSYVVVRSALSNTFKLKSCALVKRLEARWFRSFRRLISQSFGVSSSAVSIALEMDIRGCEDEKFPIFYHLITY